MCDGAAHFHIHATPEVLAANLRTPPTYPLASCVDGWVRLSIKMPRCLSGLVLIHVESVLGPELQRDPGPTFPCIQTAEAVGHASCEDHFLFYLK